MDGKMDKFLKDEIKREAEQIEREIENDPSLSEIRATEEMHQQLLERIKAYEEEQARANLSEEDKEALRLGREMMEKMNGAENADGEVEKPGGTKEEPEDADESEILGQIKRKKKSMKAYMAVLAVAVLVLAMGVTGMGGPKYVIEVLKQTLAGRETTRVDTEGADTVLTENIDEETAYQQIKDELGFDAVRPIWPSETTFVEAQVIKEGQYAVLIYENDGTSIIYEVTTNYTDGSWSYDSENTVLNEYEISTEETEVSVCEYQIEDSQEIMYSGQFDYKNVHYSLRGIMEKEEFEEIIKNLHFF